jgi:hypothetical protein
MGDVEDSGRDSYTGPIISLLPTTRADTSMGVSGRRGQPHDGHPARSGCFGQGVVAGESLGFGKP